MSLLSQNDDVLVGNPGARLGLEEAALDITRALAAELTPGALPPGLSGGDAGLSVLFEAAHRHWPDVGWDERARAHWDAAAEKTARAVEPVALRGVPWSGLGGGLHP